MRHEGRSVFARLRRSPSSQTCALASSVPNKSLRWRFRPSDALRSPRLRRRNRARSGFHGLAITATGPPATRPGYPVSESLTLKFVKRWLDDGVSIGTERRRKTALVVASRPHTLRNDLTSGPRCPSGPDPNFQRFRSRCLHLNEAEKSGCSQSDPSLEQRKPGLPCEVPAFPEDRQRIVRAIVRHRDQ